MRPRRRLLPLVVLFGVLAATTAAAFAGTASWGSAIEVPGSAALNVGGFAGLYSVSCASGGNCSAGGYYTDGSGVEALVVSEQGGAWGTALEVPGTAALNAGHNEEVASVSCAAPGDCAAGGGPVDSDFGVSPAFVVDETNGSWGAAAQVRGLARLDIGGDATVISVSCGSPGYCAAGGYYASDTDKYGTPTDFRAFVVSETNGTWSTAHMVPAAAAFGRPRRGDGDIGSVSCVGLGSCVADGSAANRQAFIVAATNGRWGSGMTVPGMAALTGKKGISALTSVSCASTGNCAAGGWYIYGGSRGRSHLFVVSERHGKWGKAMRVSGLPATYDLRVNSMSCAGAGNCAAGGFYTHTVDNNLQAFVVTEQNGVWGTAEEVPGTASLNVGDVARVSSVSCASTGNCAASGTYLDGHNTVHAFVVSEQDGVWGTAVDVPGTAALAVGGIPFPYPAPISCTRSGSCAIGGSYSDGSGASQASVTAP